MIFSSPQLPIADETFLDHVGWFVPDMKSAAATCERMGFRLTPFAVQRAEPPGGGPPHPTGTGNRCAMLGQGYLEFLAAIDGLDTPLAVQHRAAVARHPGVHLIAFSVADAIATRARLAQAGFAPAEPVHLRRPIAAADGSTAEAGFTVVRVPPELMPEGRIQLLVHRTPDLVWQPGLLTHPNGVAGLSGVLLCVEDPLEVSGRFGRFVGRAASGRGGYATVALARGRLGFATREYCRTLLPGVELPQSPVIAAVGLGSDDIAGSRRFFAARGFHPASDRQFLIDPGPAVGSTLVIHATGVQWPPEAA